MINSLENRYTRRKNIYDGLFKKQDRRVNIISNVRLLVFIAGFASAVAMYFTKWYILGIAAVLASLIVFIYLVREHTKITDNRRYSSAMSQINYEDVKRIRDEWKAFKDTGAEFKDENHGYSIDLDIFGEGSLFQKINCTNTPIGRQILKNMLMMPRINKEEIIRRQEAVSELSQSLAWRQRLFAEGRMAREELRDPDALINWAESWEEPFKSPWIIPALYIMPFIAVISLVMSFGFKLMPFYIPVAILILHFIFLKIRSRERADMLTSVREYKDSLRSYDKMLVMLEKRGFRSPHMDSLKKVLEGEKRETASAQIERLSKIVDSIANRYNAFYFVFNILTLWDYHCQLRLVRWKRKSGSCLKSWLKVIGETEALASLAVLKYDNPDWAMPEIASHPFVFKAGQMGHPLLGARRVLNDVNIDANSNILLITGSNMSGKSTLLRTAGINLVLAYIGAPVCARDFCCSIMEIYTCMRVSDNLDKSISSFYAELMRIKIIVEEAKKGKHIFFLLDEIFKGTNSTDRHTGAKALITELAGHKAMGMVSTHDLELGRLEEDTGRVRNFHFREYYDNNKIFFDYRLYKGVSVTRNAVYLMRLAGINIDEA
ncbi:MutS-like protein [Anaerobacterium chartisolvens]|uniref:MutS-like protein n=1 Tax=Anaerobacterium chartisolvens TaxID=1297424 RepID=A0A369B858_9FIRM|nr:MutS family DNA mismatch repair protein [Anaerobacterium chartisolvens]RCX17495.1 MutS-like protein [Anaerobacterium chartisolvens]